METPFYYYYYHYMQVFFGYVLIAIVLVSESTHVMQHSFSDRVRVRHWVHNSPLFGFGLKNVMMMKVMVVSFSRYQQGFLLIHMLYYCLWLYK